MKALNLLSIICASLFFTTANAQGEKTKLKARVSTASEAADDLIPVSAITGSAGVIVLKDRVPGLEEKDMAKAIPKLELYDNAKLNLVRTTVPAEKLYKRPVVLEQLVEFAGTPFLIATLRELDKGKFSVMGTRVDPNLTKPSEPYEDLVVFETGYSGAAFETLDGRADEVQVQVAPKTGHMLVITPLLRTAGRSAFMVASISKDRKVQWQHVMELEQGIAAAEIADAELDKDGNSWMLVRQKYRDRKKTEIQEEMKLFHVSAEGVRGIRFGLDRTAYVRSAIMEQMPDGSITLAGLHSSTADGWKGDVLFTVPVPAAVDDLKDPKPVQTSLSLPATRLEVRKLLRAADGSQYLVLEEYDWSEIAHYKTLKKSMKHVHGPVHVFALEKTGRERWNSTFRRSVHSDLPILGQPLAAVFENELSLFMIDSEKQAGMRDAADKPLSYLDVKDPYSVQIVFENGGKFRARNILGSGLDATLIAGRELVPIGPNRYLAYGTRSMEGKGFLPVDLEFSK